MIHLGDITKIDGGKIPIVDCITGGSPCQDLSVAGKRAGLSGERSGLFMEQLRIVKEMRKRDQEENGRTDQFIRPRFMVWENVPGAFSSNNGKDFQAVLTEIVRIVEPDAPDVPMPDKAKWTKSGCLYDEMGRWSVAWRLHDAQFWGVPQRRKRIALVADFGGLAAPEVQFERKGVSRDTEPCEETRKGVAGAVNKSIGAASYCVQGGGMTSRNANGRGVNEDVSFTINAVDYHGVAYGFKHKASPAAGGIGFMKEQSATLIRDQESAVMQNETDNHT
jgi:DNA (cytosine-5)-methyltransferase 1